MMSGSGGDHKGFAARALVLCGAAVLLFFVGRAGAQGAPAGPLPAAQPSDQPPPAPPPKSTQTAGRANLAGTWKLNTSDSDDPRQKMREARQNSRGGNMGGGGVWGGGPGGWGGRNRGSGGRGNMSEEFSQLTIEETPSMTKVTGSSGRVLAFYSASADQGAANGSSQQGGAKSSPNDNGDGSAAPVGQWQGSQFFVTQQMRDGGTTSRTYEMSPDNGRLYVITKIEDRRLKQPVTYRLVYDPVQAKLPGGE